MSEAELTTTGRSQPIGTKNTVTFPEPLGGASWGGGSVDPNLGYFFINVRNEGTIGHMIKPSELVPPATNDSLLNIA